MNLYFDHLCACADSVVGSFQWGLYFWICTPLHAEQHANKITESFFPVPSEEGHR